MVQKHDFRQPSEYYFMHCPGCGARLGWKQILERKRKKVVVCKKCGRKMDERFVVW